MDRLAPLLFRNFWTVLALACAAGECILVRVYLRPGWPAAADVALFAVLAVANRAACVWCERERHRAPITSRAGQSVLAAGCGAAIAAAHVGAAAILWALWAAFVPVARAGGGVATGLPWETFAPVARAAGLAGALVAAWGYVWAPRRLRLARRAVPIAGLPATLEGYTIAHLSDIHVGPLADAATVERAFLAVSRAGVDLVCITGDLVDSRHADLDRWLPLFGRLAARDGVVAILGNHDREAGPDRVAAALARHTRVRLLRDETLLIERGGETLAVVGLDGASFDPAGPRLARLMAGLPAGAVPILLAHHPDAFSDAVRAGVPLTLAGHTHGGQLAVPGFRHLNIAHLLVSAYDVGWFRTEQHRLHVSPGLGVSGQRLRIGTRPEITLLRLASAPAPPA